MGKLFKNFKTRKQLKAEIARLQALADVAEMAYLQAKTETLDVKRLNAVYFIDSITPKAVALAQIKIMLSEQLEPYIEWKEEYNPEFMETAIRGTVLLALKPRERGLDNGEE